MRSLDRMHIGQKLAVLGGLVTLLFLIPTLLLLSRVHDDLERTRRAIEGLDRALALTALQRAVLDHRAASAALLSGDATAAAARETARREADQRFSAATSSITNGAAASARRLAATAAAWKALADAAAGKVISALDSQQRHAEVLAQLQETLEATVDEHALSADPEMRVQRSAMTAFHHAPRLADSFGIARSLGMQLLATRQGGPEDKQAVSGAVQQALERMALLKAEASKTLARDGGLRGKVEGALQALEAELGKAVRTTRVDVIFSGSLDSGSARYHAAMAAFPDAHARFVADLAGAAREVLDARAAEQGREILFGVLATLVALAVAVALAWWMARSIVRPLAFAVRVADGIAAGQLDHPIDPRRARSQEAARLLAAFGSMQSGLSHMAREIQASSREIHRAADQVALGNTELSSRTEEQASSLEETAATMEELTATVGSNAENARRAADVVTQAGEAATRGAEAVGEAVRTMDQINAASKRIVDITAVIDTIAFQTNILALNAAVEAARAGEQGRGFAVVASEVRSLAQRASASAKEIKALIRESATAAEQGTLRVAESGRAMDDIMESVQQVAKIFTEISSASAEQGHGIQQVNRAITQMDRVTQENAALVNEAAASSQSLQDQAARLAVLVERFRIGSDTPSRVPEEASSERGRMLPASEGYPRLSGA